MKRTFAILGTILAFAITLAGCGELAQRRIGGTRHGDDLAEGPPSPAESLAISNAPETKARPLENPISQATFLPDATPEQPSDFNPLMNQQALQLLHVRAQQRLASMAAYSFRLRHRESIDGRPGTEEVFHVTLRRAPFSVRLTWLDPEAKGREAIYVAGKFNDEIQILPRASETGVRWSISPTDPKIRAMTRYRINDEGLASLVVDFGRLVNGERKGATLKYLGPMSRKESSVKLETALQTAPPGSDPTLLKGGERWWYFDPTNGLPVLVISQHANREVEYFWHDQIQGAALGDDDFNLPSLKR